MKRYNSINIYCLAFVILISCSDKKKEENIPEKGVETVLPDVKNEVSVMALQKSLHRIKPICVLRVVKLWFISM